MSLTDHHRRVISGQARGIVGSLERTALGLAEGLYRRGVDYRNRAFDRRRYQSLTLDVPVISIGNITVGGTGKTPTVIWLCRQLLERQRKPAVLSRGYKARAGRSSDEMGLIAQQLPNLICISNPDRLAAGKQAIQESGADVLVLDDGFQHRRLRRDLDVVLIDATCPFGYGHLLPRGLLRESVDSLGRADLIIITRSDQAEPGSVHQLVRRLEQQLPQLPVIRSIHKPTGFIDLAGQPVEGLKSRARRALLFAAVGNPQAFERTARQFGVRPVAHRWWPDHHNYTRRDVELLAGQMARHQATLLLTTEKDAVKLRDLDVEWPGKIAALRVEIQCSDSDQLVVDDLLDTILGGGSKAEAGS